MIVRDAEPRRDRPRRFGTAARATVALSLLSGCSIATPVVVQATKLPNLQGRVTTTAGYTGAITTESGLCRGSFTGTPGQPVAVLEVSCNDGRNGVGTAVLTEGSFTSGDVRLSDGSRLTIRANGPTFP